MNRPAQILGAVALAYLGGACGSGTGPEPDAGLLLDAGFHYTALSQGIATLSGAFTGTASVDGFAFSIPTGFPLLDGGNSGPYVYAQVSNEFRLRAHPSVVASTSISARHSTQASTRPPT